MNKRSKFLATGISLFVLVAVVAFWNISRKPPESETLRLRLQWIPQAQFSGYLVAKEKGFYSELGLSVEILPAGPDLSPQTTVASGVDDIGVGVPNQIISANANGVPLRIIAQIFQDSANRYVLLPKNRLENLSEIKGKKVGLWLGGDEAEFQSMLTQVGLTMSDVDIIPQGFTVTPFLKGDYELSQVTVYNELITISDEIDEELQILSPSDYESAILGDMLFCHERMLSGDNKENMIKFVAATLKGWQYSLDHPDETLDIILKVNPDLDRDHQRKQLEAVSSLIKGPIGEMSSSAYEQAVNILVSSGQIEREIDAHLIYDDSILREAKEQITGKTVP